MKAAPENSVPSHEAAIEEHSRVNNVDNSGKLATAAAAAATSDAERLLQMSYEEAMQYFCSGFSTCAKEAIRYLVEEEGLSRNDPFVAGLNQHLVLQETFYLLQCLSANYDHTSNHGTLPSYEQFEMERNMMMPPAVNDDNDSDYSSAHSEIASPRLSPSANN